MSKQVNFQPEECKKPMKLSEILTEMGIVLDNEKHTGEVNHHSIDLARVRKSLQLDMTYPTA